MFTPIVPVWTWPQIVTSVLSVIALGLSITAIWQRIRYHPQPKVVLDWDEQVRSVGGVYYVTATLHNYGDAPARDVRVLVSTSHTPKTPWAYYATLDMEPPENIVVPIVQNVSMKVNLTLDFTVHDPNGAMRIDRPTLTVRWRQAPFKGRPRHLSARLPDSPAIRGARSALGNK